jgi:hypothetical protein
MPNRSRELSYTNPATKDGPKSNQETKTFDPLLSDEPQTWCTKACWYS